MLPVHNVQGRYARGIPLLLLRNMSNHRSNKSIQLHYSQVTAGRKRAFERAAERRQHYEAIIKDARTELTAKSFIGFCTFVSMVFITVTYTGWLT